MTASEVALAIERRPGRWADENELQQHIGALLAPLGFKSEFIVGGYRLDFYCAEAGIAVEIKVGGPAGVVLRQLMDYAEREEVRGIVLATTKVSHRGYIPTELRGKPVALARLWMWGLG